MKSLAIIGGVIVSILFTVFAVTCTGKAPGANLATPSSTVSPSANSLDPPVATSGNLPLHTMRDVPLSGGATRLDYQSLDSDNGRLFIAHLGSDLMTVFI